MSKTSSILNFVKVSVLAVLVFAFSELVVNGNSTLVIILSMLAVVIFTFQRKTTTRKVEFVITAILASLISVGAVNNLMDNVYYSTAVWVFSWVAWILTIWTGMNDVVWEYKKQKEAEKRESK